MKKKRKIVKSFFALLYVGALSVPLFAYAFNYFKDWHNASAYNEQTSNLLGNESVGDLVQPITNTYYEKKYYETNAITYDSDYERILGLVDGNVYRLYLYNISIDDNITTQFSYVDLNVPILNLYYEYALTWDDYWETYNPVNAMSLYINYNDDSFSLNFWCKFGYFRQELFNLGVDNILYSDVNIYVDFIYYQEDVDNGYYFDIQGFSQEYNINYFLSGLDTEELQNYYYYEEIQFEDTNIGGIPSNQEIQMPTMNDVSQSTLKSMGAYEGNDAYLSDMIDNSNNVFIGIDYFGLFGFDIENNASNSAYSYLFINWYINYILSMALIVFMPEILLIFIQWCRDLIYSMTDKTEGI